MKITIQPPYIHNSAIAATTAVISLGGSPFSSVVCLGFATLSALNQQVNFSNNIKFPRPSGLTPDIQENLEASVRTIAPIALRIASIALHASNLYSGMFIASCFLSVTPFTLIGALGTSALTLAITDVFNSIFQSLAPPSITLEFLFNTAPMAQAVLVDAFPEDTIPLVAVNVPALN